MTTDAPIQFAAHSAEPVVRSLPHEFTFDPTYGFTFQELVSMPPPDNAPDDFADFWLGLYQRALNLPLEPEVKVLDGWDQSDHRLSLLHYDSLGGARIGAWLLTPKDEKSVERAIVCGHGYGGRDGPGVTPGLEEGAAMIFPVSRGLPTLSRESVPEIDEVPHHVLVGIENKDRYVIGGCVADLVGAVTLLLDLFPQVDGRIAYWGNSFGGGLGALFVPWESRLRRAALGQPTFGHQPYRVTVPCNGSGSHVKRYYDREPAIMETLRYFDAATAAGYIHVPTLVVPSLFDPVVPPPGQFAVFNAIANELKTLHCMTSGHFQYEGEAEEDRIRAASLKDFFADL